MNRGQVAIESLILLLVIMSATIYITSLYYQTHNNTLIYGLARNYLTEKSNSFDEVVIIESLKLEIGETNTLTIKTKPNTYTYSDFNADNLEEKIINNSYLEEITVIINN